MNDNSPDGAQPPPATENYGSLEDLLRRAARGMEQEVRQEMCDNLDEPLPDLKRGDLLPRGESPSGRFQILNQFDEGGTARIYLALDHQRDDRLTIIKVVHLNGRSYYPLSRLMDEARNTSNLNPEDCAYVLDRGLETDFAWFAMEYLEGLTLASLLQSEGRLTWEQAKKVCKDVLEGLSFAHDRGVIHCDLKPSNIILPNKRRRWKLLDWGLARTLDTSGVALDPCLSGTFVYLAPECFGSVSDPRGCYSPQSDFYAVGIMLAEMLIGTNPIPFNRNPLVVRDAHLQKDLAVALEQVPDLPEEARRVVLRATDNDPSKRYHNAQELLADLDRPATSRRTCRKALYLGLLAIVLLALAVLGWHFYPDAPAPQFDGELDLWVVAKGPQRLAKPVVVGGPRAHPPLHAGTGVSIQGKLDQGPPAFFYVIYIPSDGKARRVYPEGWSAEQLPAAEAAQKEFHCPLTLDQKQDGLELVVWLVRARRLTRSDNERINALLANVKWHLPPQWKDEDVDVRWKNGNLLKAGERGMPKPQPDDPFTETEKLLQALKDQGLASYTYAFAYSYVGH